MCIRDRDCYNRWHGGGNESKMPREYKGIRLIRIPTFRRTALNAFVYSVLAAVRAAAGGYDVIHFHAEGPAAMAFMPRLLGIPVVVTIHGLDWQRAKWGGFATRYLRWGERNAARFSDALLVLSRGNKRYFRDTYNRNAIYIPNGVNVKPCLEPEKIGRAWGLEKMCIRDRTYRVFHKHSVQTVLDEIVSWAKESAPLLGCTPCTLGVGIGRSHYEACLLYTSILPRYTVQVLYW